MSLGEGGLSKMEAVIFATDSLEDLLAHAVSTARVEHSLLRAHKEVPIGGV